MPEGRTGLPQLPTQAFFTETFGIPLTMDPNFEDLSCTCTFGRAPPPIEKDPCYDQPCFQTECMRGSTPAGSCVPGDVAVMGLAVTQKADAPSPT